MLQAKDLRSGNKVQTLSGEIITVQQILSHSVIYDTQIKVSREVVSAGRSARTAYATQVVEMVKEVDLQELNPILLTPKILEKCGIRNFVREEWILTIGKTHIDFEFNEEDGLRLRPPYPHRTNIQYLHQLQNLLYAIIGHELDIEL
jgi:hypothetical protein